MRYKVDDAYRQKVSKFLKRERYEKPEATEGNGLIHGYVENQEIGERLYITRRYT